MASWKPMRTAPKEGSVKLLGTTDAASETLSIMLGEWNKESDVYTTKSGWIILAVAWRDSE